METEEKHPVLPALSGREKEVLELAAQGLVDKQIASELGVAYATVNTYWSRIRQKLGAANRSHAVALGMPHNRLEQVDAELAAFIIRRMQHEAIMTCDSYGTLLTWNEGVKELFGYSEEEWVGAHCSIFFVPNEKDDALRELTDAAKAGASVNDRWHMRKDGSRFWGTNMVLSLEGGSPARFAKIVREKTERDSSDSSPTKQ